MLLLFISEMLMAFFNLCTNVCIKLVNVSCPGALSLVVVAQLVAAASFTKSLKKQTFGEKNVFGEP